MVERNFRFMDGFALRRENAKTGDSAFFGHHEKIKMYG